MNKHLLVVFLMSVCFYNFGSHEYEAGCQTGWGHNALDAVTKYRNSQERLANQSTRTVDTYTSEFPGAGYTPTGSGSTTPQGQSTPVTVKKDSKPAK